MEGWYRDPAIFGSSLAKGALSATGMIGDLQDFLQGQADQRIIDPARRMLGLRDPVTPRNLATGQEQFYPGAAGQPLQKLFPGATPDQLPAYLEANRAALGRAPDPTSRMDSGQFVQLGQQLGAVDRPNLQPQNATERYTAAVGEGVGGGLPFLALGGGVPNAIRTAIQGGAAGAGGELASEFSNNPWARVGGGLLGALGAGGVMSAGGGAVNALRGNSGPVIAAADRLGIPPMMAGDMTGNPIMQQLQAYSQTSPGGASRMANAGNRVMGAFDDAIENTASNLGTARTAEQAGTALGMGERAWINNFQQRQRTAWANSDMHTPLTSETPLTNYANTLNQVSQDIPNMPATAARLQQPLTRGLLEDLVADSQGGVPTMRDARGIRTRIGERLGEPVIAGDTSRAELQRLWGALTQDIEAQVATRGPAAQQAFQDAVDVSRNGHQFIDNVLSKISQGTPARPTGLMPGPAAERALSTGGAGGQFLQAIRDEMPDAADALAAYKLRDMAATAPGRPNPTGSQYSPNRFLTESHRSRLAPEAHDALFGADPYVSQQLADLGTVAMPMRNTEAFVNNSRTAPTQQLQTILTKGDYGLWPANWAISRAVTSPLVNRLVGAPPVVPGTPLSRRAILGELYPQLRGLLAP
jgi:hypothetical protein